MSPRLWNTVSALMPDGAAIALGHETRQGRLCRFHRLGLHDRQGRAVARPRGDALQGGGSASRVAFQQRLGNDGSRLGRAGKGAGENPRRNASRQSIGGAWLILVEQPHFALREWNADVGGAELFRHGLIDFHLCRNVILHLHPRLDGDVDGGIASSVTPTIGTGSLSTRGLAASTRRTMAVASFRSVP